MRSTRRQFLQTTGSLLGGVAVSSWLGRTSFAAEKPVAWRVTCRDAMAKATGKASIWEALQAVGVEGVEVWVGDDLNLPSLFHPTNKYSLATAEGIAQVAADAKAAGVQVTALCIANRFDERPDVEVKQCIAAAQAAQQLGAPAIRIDVVPRNKMPREELLAVSVKALKQVMPAIEATGVALGIENHSTTTNDPDFLEALFNGVGSPRLGLTLDVGNFYWFGHPLAKVYDLVERFASRVVHTHCKSIHYPAETRDTQREMGWKYGEYGCPIDEGDIDYARVAAILAKVGYHNDMCIENEFLGKLSGDEATKVLCREVELLKQIRKS